MVFLDSKGRIAKQIANRPGVSILRFRQKARRLTDTTGPYHKLTTAGGILGAGIGSEIKVPCSIALPTSGPGLTDTPFVYLGGKTDATSASAVETGMQYNRHANGAFSVNNWQPYIRAATVYVNYESDMYNFYYTPYDVNAPQGEYTCDPASDPITLDMDFDAEVTYSGGGSGTYYECLQNLTETLDDGSYVEFAVCPEIGQSNSDGWEGWPSFSSEGYCTVSVA